MRTQRNGESLEDYSRALMHFHDRMDDATDGPERAAIKLMKDKVLKEQFTIRGLEKQLFAVSLKGCNLKSQIYLFSGLGNRPLRLCLNLRIVVPEVAKFVKPLCQLKIW